MSFIQYEFVVLQAAVLAAMWAIRDARWQNAVLIVASAIFYGWLVPWWLVLLYVSSLVDFVLAQLMVRARSYRNLWLGLSLTAQLSLLFYFKYYDFFAANITAAARAVGIPLAVPLLHLVLPAGISFYTFQTISYSIDVWRGDMRPRTNALNYVAYVTFFPQLVAGPIERATHLLVQLEKYRPFRLEDLRAGFGLALFGVFKKVVLADSIAPYVDKVFVLDDPQGPLIVASTFAFMAQIYTDFSGYTDIARGTARMMGIDLMRNFDEPYMAATTIEFWQRWHMSLSTWIRDYLTTPLLGDVGAITWYRFAAAVMTTMTIMGFWHGASWNFVLLGAWQGLCVVTYAGLLQIRPPWLAELRGGRALATLFHTLVILPIGALMFREHDMNRVVRFFTLNPFLASETQWRAAVTVWAMALIFGAAPIAIEHVVRRTVLARFRAAPWFLLVESTVWSVYAVLIALFYRSSVQDFVYFQF